MLESDLPLVLVSLFTEWVLTNSRKYLLQTLKPSKQHELYEIADVFKHLKQKEAYSVIFSQNWTKHNVTKNFYASFKLNKKMFLRNFKTVNNLYNRLSCMMS